MAEHRIYPHGPLEELIEGVWRVRGTLSIPLMRNMIVLQLGGGELLLYSVVALNEAGMSKLRALGDVGYIVLPHAHHQLDTGFYRDRFPDAKVLAPRSAREAVAARGRLDGTVEDVLPGLGFTLHEAPGSKTPEYAYEWPLPSGGRLLMLSDFLGGTQAADTSRFTGRTLMRFLVAARAPVGVSRVYRLTQARDLRAIRDFSHRLADIPDVRLITVSHGEPIRQNCAAALRAV